MSEAGLGRGLGALLGGAPGQDSSGTYLHVDVDEIRPNPRQPRKDLTAESVAELARSVSARGILQPLLVRRAEDGYELIAGERRWQAARAAGLGSVPVVVRDGAGAESLELALIENVARRNLNPVDEARALAALVDEMGLKHEDVAARVGRSRAAVSNLIRILELPDDVLAMLEEGTLTAGHGRALLQVPDQESRRALARLAARKGMSVRSLEAMARGSGGETRSQEKGRDPEGDALGRAVARAARAKFGVRMRVREQGKGGHLEIPYSGVEELRAVLANLGLDVEI